MNRLVNGSTIGILGGGQLETNVMFISRQVMLQNDNF